MNKEKVNHPDHYNQYPVEVIDMMVKVFGRRKTIDFCIINAFKYRMRIGHKDDVSQDLEKEKWYLGKAKELQCGVEKEVVGGGEFVVSDGSVALKDIFDAILGGKI